MVLITGKKTVFKQKREFAPGSWHSSLPGNAHQGLLVQKGSQDQPLKSYFLPCQCHVMSPLAYACHTCRTNLRVARRKTKLIQGTVEGEGVWGIAVVQGFSRYQMLVCPPSWEERGGKPPQRACCLWNRQNRSNFQWGNMTLTPNRTLLAAKMACVLQGTSQTKQLETPGF